MFSLADLHCDTAAKLFALDVDLRSEDLHVNLDKLRAHGSALQVFAVCTEDTERGGARYTRAMRILSRFFQNLSAYAGAIRLCRSASELSSAMASGRAAALLAVEGGGAFDGVYANIDRFYNLGVRIVTLTWNGENELACGQPGHGRLTRFGLESLRRMHSLGMLPDLSHMCAESFFDVCSRYDGVFLCSHSNLAAVCPHERNLADWQVTELFRRGGVLGLNLYPPFLRSGPSRAADVLPHLEHALSLGGEGQICLGCDFDGEDMLPEDVTGLESMAALYTLLQREGYGQALIDGLFFDNALRFFQRFL